jgi:hypothetical protein
MKNYVMLAVFLLGNIGCKQVTEVVNGHTTAEDGHRILQRVTETFRTGIRIWSEDREYHETNIHKIFMPVSTTSKIEIIISGTAAVRSQQPESACDITIYKNDTDLLSEPQSRPYRFLSGANDCNFDPVSCFVDYQLPVTVMHNDDTQREAGKPITYSLRIRTGEPLTFYYHPPLYECRWALSGGEFSYTEMTITEYEN